MNSLPQSTDSTYSGICLPSALPNSFDYLTLPLPTLSSHDDLASVSYSLLTTTQIIFSSKTFSDLTKFISVEIIIILIIDFLFILLITIESLFGTQEYILYFIHCYLYALLL